MNKREEELQSKVESQLDVPASNIEELAYQHVFRALTKEPKLDLPIHFADMILKKIVDKKKREARRDFFWLAFGVAFLLVGLIVTAAVAGLTLQLGFLKDISGYAGVLVFGATLIVLFNWVEKRVILPASK